MNYLKFDLTGIEIKELTTRISFDIATARSLGLPLVKFVIHGENNERLEKALKTRLLNFKRQGRIAFFVSLADLSSGATEAQYLLNKFPELKDEKAEVYTVGIYVKM